MECFREPAREIPVGRYDVVVAGGGTGGVMAAIAAARTGARTALVESKGYVGGTIVEGGTALHSYYNLYKPFNIPKRQIVKGIPQEIIDRLVAVDGSTGHVEMVKGYDYDSICTAIDVELYKLVALEMLVEAGVDVLLNTMLVGAIADNGTMQGVVTESRSGREALMGANFVDCSGYGDLCAFAGASFTEPNDHKIANSMGVGGVNIERYCAFMEERNALTQLSYGQRSGKPDQIVRVSGRGESFPQEFREQAKSIGLSSVTTSVHDDYFMFIKINYKLPESPTNRDVVSKAELELRRRQYQAIKLMRAHIPGCENAFIARTSPSICIRRGRCIECDHDISLKEILEGTHFEDDIMAYGFHDCAPRLQIKDGKSYGIPFRALLPKGLNNVLATGMMISSDWEAHMSTRNTVSCMGQGQAAGTAAAMAAQKKIPVRKLPINELQSRLRDDGVHLEK